MFPENGSFLSWVPRGKLRNRNKLVHYRGKPLERHLKKGKSKKTLLWMFDPFWDPTKNTLYLKAILFWATWGKMRSTGNQHVYQGAKVFEKHPKCGNQRKHCNECLIRFEIHQKTRLFWKQFFFLGYVWQNEEHWKPARLPRSKSFWKAP